ncbi:MAG TPA: hypothetical protein PLC80_18855 [Draconibacterium sp.]|nr:hypothetical protein [Draconibacterium sp.]
MNSFLRSKYLFSLVLASVFIFASFSNPFPDGKLFELVSKSNLFNQRFPQEKVYLHLDRPSYWTNDTIWFKAYLKDSPIVDCNLHVELANATGTIISRKLYWAQSGLAYGQIGLSDALTSGVYQIRAYTDWMRNFDNHWYFKEDLIIWNLKDKQSDEKLIQLRKREVDFQFLPEGGTFVAGVKNRMAFKATDKNGFGLDVSGMVSDDRGKNLFSFKSGFKGMGSFMIEPQEGRKYSAEIYVEGGVTMKVDLPEQQVEGVTMAVNSYDSDTVKIQIAEKAGSSFSSHSANDYYIVAKSNGMVYMNRNAKTVNGIASLAIEKDKLPTGITQFTLFSQNLVPLCERLIFVNHHDFVSLKIEPGKKDYLRREKVNLEVKAFNRNGLPSSANLSLSVFNTDNQLENEEYPNNILTNFLLCTELKGKVESPAYYFKDDSLSTIQALDNLMLTHGYRHFEWEVIRQDQYPEIVYQPENGIRLKGSIKSLAGRKPVSNATVNLLTLANGIGFNQTVCDSTGYFVFPGLFFYDTVSVTLQAKAENGKKTLIDLDRSAFTFPEFKFIPKEDQSWGYQYVDDKKVDIANSLNEVNLQKINRKWKLSDTIMLNEIKVIAAKYKFGKRPMRLYEKADYSLDIITQPDELGNVFHKLVGKSPHLYVRVFDEGHLASNRELDVLHLNESYVKLMINYDNAPVVYVLDGSVVDMDLIADIPAGKFEKVEILKNGMVYGNPMGGAVCFFTKKGAFTRSPNSIGMKSSTIIGYSVIRKFYSPDYETQQQSQIKDDFRNTLYWNPVVRTDSTGVTQVSFYNSDQAGNVIIVAEGIDATGKLCRGTGQYKVKN